MKEIQQNEKAVYWVEENICKLCVWYVANIQIYKELLQLNSKKQQQKNNNNHTNKIKKNNLIKMGIRSE